MRAPGEETAGCGGALGRDKKPTEPRKLRQVSQGLPAWGYVGSFPLRAAAPTFGGLAAELGRGVWGGASWEDGAEGDLSERAKGIAAPRTSSKVSSGAPAAHGWPHEITTGDPLSSET